MRRAIAAIGRLPDWLWAAAALLVVALFCAVQWCGPWLTRDVAPIEATPVPPARAAPLPIAVAPGATACVTGVEIPERTRGIAFSGSLPDPQSRPPAVVVTATSGAWSTTGTIPAGWPVGITAPIHGPARTLTGRVCLRNAGRVALVLNANTEPGATAATSTLQGRATPAPIITTMLGSTTTRWAYLGTMLDRAADLTWRPLSGWSARLLAVLAVALTLGASLGALVWTMRDDARREAEAEHDLP